MPELTFEEQQPLFADAILEQPQRVYRIDNWNYGRYYYTYEEGQEEPTFYLSVTNMIGQTLPPSQHLQAWQINKALQEQDPNAPRDFMEERSVYGTFMHMEFTSFLIAKKIDFDTMEDRLDEYLYNEKEDPALASKWIEHLKKDVLSHIQFIMDHNVKPIGIEMVLASADGYAGAVDLICEMDWTFKGFFGELYKSGPNKGNPKETKRTERIYAVIDYKSGRKGFHESNEIQLECYRRLVTENFPYLATNENINKEILDKRGIKIFNLGMKDWRSVPTYNLKDQSESPSLEKLDPMIELSGIINRNLKKTQLQISGEFDLSKPDISKNFEFVNIVDKIKERHE